MVHCTAQYVTQKIDRVGSKSVRPAAGRCLTSHGRPHVHPLNALRRKDGGGASAVRGRTARAGTGTGRRPRDRAGARPTEAARAGAGAAAAAGAEHANFILSSRRTWSPPRSSPRNVLVRQNSMLGTPRLASGSDASLSDMMYAPGEEIDDSADRSRSPSPSLSLLSSDSDGDSIRSGDQQRPWSPPSTGARPSTFSDYSTDADHNHDGDRMPVPRLAHPLRKRTRSEDALKVSGADSLLKTALLEEQLFEPLTESALTALLVGVEVLALGAGRCLYMAGQRGPESECAYVVKSGAMLLTPEAARGGHADRLLLAQAGSGSVSPSSADAAASQPSGGGQVLRQGAIFGVEALLCEAPRCGTATAAGDSGTQVWAIRRELFLSAVAATEVSASAISADDENSGTQTCAEVIAHTLHLAYPA